MVMRPDRSSGLPWKSVDEMELDELELLVELLAERAAIQLADDQDSNIARDDVGE